MKLSGEKITSVVEPTAVIIHCLDLQLPWQCDIILQHFHTNVSNYARCKAAQNQRYQHCLLMGCAMSIKASSFISLSLSQSLPLITPLSLTIPQVSRRFDRHPIAIEKRPTNAPQSIINLQHCHYRPTIFEPLTKLLIETALQPTCLARLAMNHLI